jgi:hypothetical protein
VRWQVNVGVVVVVVANGGGGNTQAAAVVVVVVVVVVAVRMRSRFGQCDKMNGCTRGRHSIAVVANGKVTVQRVQAGASERKDSRGNTPP